jgi:hypothetical protein
LTTQKILGTVDSHPKIKKVVAFGKTKSLYHPKITKEHYIMRILPIAVGVAIGFVIYHQLSDPLRAENRRLRAENARLSLESIQNKEDAEKFRTQERAMRPLRDQWRKERQDRLSKLSPEERMDYHMRRAVSRARWEENRRKLEDNNFAIDEEGNENQ